jgi:hypothetical protein
MSPLQITAVLIRLFAIWCGVDAASWLLSVWDPVHLSTYGVGYTIAFGSLYILLAVVLWAFPTLVARRMLVPNSQPSAGTIDPKALLNVAVVAIGLFAIAQGLPDALSALVLVSESDDYGVQLTSERNAILIRVLASFLQPLLGFVLLVRAPAITRLLWPRVQASARDA